MQTSEPRASSNPNPLFDRKEFRKLALHALSELRDLVRQNLPSHDLQELPSMSIWARKLPSFKDDAFSVLFERFPALHDAFDFRKTARELCTLENLAVLVGTCGSRRITRMFEEYFRSRATQKWQILIPLENVQIRKVIPPVTGDLVHLRMLTDDERDQLQKLIPDAPLDGRYFSVEEKAGDAESAVSRARSRIREFLAPYYLHRIRNPDHWWRARTMRQIVSPLAFYVGPEELPGASRELRQLPTEASDLFTPDPGIEPDWKSSVEELARTWNLPKLDGDPIGERLQLCSRWMFSAESDELIENAFLKHSIAWEALLPSKANRLRRCWYLLLLCLGASDSLCVKTVSELSRLVDRRNSFAHPEISRTLYGTVERDLIKLKQSLWWGFDRALRLWQAPGGQTLNWSQALSRCYNAALSDDVPADYDDAAIQMLHSLGYIERDENGVAVLSREGHCLRVEAHITRARELWPADKNPKESVCLVARALQISTDEILPPYQYHSLLTLKDRSESMGRNAFEEGWRLAAPGGTPPTEDEITVKLLELERDYGLTPDRVGWKRQ